MAGGYQLAVGNRIVIKQGGSFLTGWGVSDNPILASENAGYPYIFFYMNVDMAGNAGSNSACPVYARPLNIIGDNDGEPPSDNNLQIYLGDITIGGSGSTFYQEVTHANLLHRPHFDCDIYIKNIAGVRWDNWDLYCYTVTYRRIQ